MYTDERVRCWLQAGIGDKGASALGTALRVNKTLRVLGLDNNAVQPAGAQAIGNALHENPALEEVHLRGMEGGLAAAKVLVQTLKDRPPSASLRVVEMVAALPRCVANPPSHSAFSCLAWCASKM
jgi:hypothetical protein